MPSGRGKRGACCGKPAVSPPRPLLASSPGIPLPFQSRTSPRPPDVLVFQQKLRFRNTRTCRHGIAWRGDQTKRFVFPLPAVRPGRRFGGSQVVPAPRQSLRRRAGVRTKGNTLGLTSCRPPCGDGCVRPPVPKAKLLLEQAGSEHRASARGTGGDSGVWKGASKGGNAPITGPFPPPGGHKGKGRDRRGENGKMQVVPATNSTTHLPVRPARGLGGSQVVPAPLTVSAATGRGTHKGPPLS